MTSPARIARGHPEENLDMFRAVTNDCLSRALSSAVEHQYHTLGVAGSNPAARTNPASPDDFHGDFPRRFHPPGAADADSASKSPTHRRTLPLPNRDFGTCIARPLPEVFADMEDFPLQ